jgi:hypothetical protein
MKIARKVRGCNIPAWTQAPTTMKVYPKLRNSEARLICLREWNVGN